MSFQGKEIFTVRVEGAGRYPSLPLLRKFTIIILFLSPWCPAGKVSDSIAKLRAEVMTKLNAHMASESLTTNGEGSAVSLWLWIVGDSMHDTHASPRCPHFLVAYLVVCNRRPQPLGGGGVGRGGRGSRSKEKQKKAEDGWQVTAARPGFHMTMQM